MSKLLIIKPSSLGDVIHGLQVAQSIKSQMPNAHITWVAADAYVPLVRACSTVERVLVFKRKGGIDAFKQLIGSIREEYYDWVIDMQGLARSGAMTFLSRADNKIGRSDAREGSRLSYHKVAPSPPVKRPHAVEILLELLPLMGLKPELRETLRFQVSQPPIRLPIAFSHSLLVFPESRREEKVWPHFADLLRTLAKQYPERTFAWCGSEHVCPYAPQADNILNLAGQTRLSDIIWLMQHGGGVLANDSGPMHIAAALGNPVMALFGPTHPSSYGPYPLERKTHLVMRAPNGAISSLSKEAVLEKIVEAFLPIL